jgi:tetratricopeptide (TPR) repeat protein
VVAEGEFVISHMTGDRFDMGGDYRGANVFAKSSISLYRVYQQTRPGEADPADLAAANARLAELPLDAVPDPAPLPPGSRMPQGRNPLFVGRADNLRALAAALKAGETAAVGQIAAATGLGGIGKTQLANEFVHRYGQYFRGGVFWLSFADPAAVAAEVAACGGPGGLDLRLDFGSLPLDDQLRCVLAAWQSPLPRLLVFDNCEAEDLLAAWRPPAGGGRVLLTCRRAEWSRALDVHALPLGVLQPAESMTLLRWYRPDLPPDDPDLIAIADELGDLPLALHLAGSFLEHYRHAAFGTPAAYLAELRQADLLAHRSLTAGGYSPTGHEQHVARTFALSYDRLKPDDATDALALKLLARAACFAPGVPIPRDLLSASLPGSAEGQGEAEIQREDSLARLSELGLLEAQDKGALVLHPLLAMFVRREVGEAVATEARAAVEAAVFAAAARLNQEGYPASLSTLEPHVRAVAEGAAARESKWASSLYNELGHHLGLIADFAGAQQAYKQALQLDEKIIGPDHPDVVLRLNNLCHILRRGGDLVQARTCIERALAIGRRTLDPEHFYITSAMSNLAATLGDEGNLARMQGDVAGARAVFEQAQAVLEQVLAIWRRTLGPEDLRVGTLLTSLSQIMLGLGNPAGARVVAEQALQIKEKTLGPDHPDVAFCLNNLAGTLMEDLIGARAACRRALAIYEHTYGLDHRTSRLKRFHFT